MSFKSMVEADNRGVFLTAAEFAELHFVRYDGTLYGGTDGIPVLLTKVKEMKCPVVANMAGVHLVSATAHIALADLCGIVPEQKKMIEINDGFALGKPYFRKYTVVTSDCEMGIVNLELEAYDE